MPSTIAHGREPGGATMGRVRLLSLRSWITKGLALFFALYALYACWTLLYRLSPLKIVVAGICGAAAVGLWLGRPWSRWVVYLITAGLCLYFTRYLWRLVQAGWPYEDLTRSFVSVLPGLVLLVFGIGAAVHVGSVFRRS